MSARASSGIAPWQFDEYVLAEADGYATPEQLSVLAADPAAWRVSLGVMLREAEENLQRARSLPGDERDQVVSDLELEVERLEAAVARQFPERVVEPKPRRERQEQSGEQRQPVPAGRTQLQVSWEPGRVVAWAGGLQAPAGSAKEVAALLAAAGAPESGWDSHPAVALSGGVNADARAIAVGDVLGWLVAAGTGQAGDDIGSSVRWLGRVAVWAVELTARGAMVPQLRRRTRRSASAKDTNGSYSVRWTPALAGYRPPSERSGAPYASWSSTFSRGRAATRPASSTWPRTDST